jgi:hydroxyacylglutathione hydrolase
MIFVERFYDDTLAQASYLIGSTETHTCVVIDANRDVEQYIRAAAEEGLAITHVTETHIHADFVSGSRELASRVGARLYLSDEGGPEWKYAYAGDARAVLLKDGDTFDVGSIRIEAVHTPGHTPEHLIFLVTDTSITNQPVAAVTGDFLFVGDVGRPDLLERTAHVAGSMDGAARALFHSLQRLHAYPDYLQIWPGHGAGSACGKGLGSLPQSTLGYERRTNWALASMAEGEFVRRVLDGQPDPPPYFGEMKRINKQGPRARGHLPAPEHLPVDRIAALVASGAPVIDVRPAAEFAERHIPGSINIPLNRSFTTWAGWLIPYAVDYYLIVGGPGAESLQEAVYDLAIIGLDRLAGYATDDVLRQWEARGDALGRVPQVDVNDVAQKLHAGSTSVLDVRSRAEWAAGHIRGAEHIPIGELLDRVETLSRSRPIVVHCQGGARSAIAASLLRARGFSQVMNMPGGFSEWESAGQPVDREPIEATVSRR